MSDSGFRCSISSMSRYFGCISNNTFIKPDLLALPPTVKNAFFPPNVSNIHFRKGFSPGRAVQPIEYGLVLQKLEILRMYV
ncbi:MAG: hypothetical protein WAM42_10200 [Candidatus Nitrosopolaris sp.]